ncbi:c-type cytochrome [Belnapia rosea]|uniref:c-type cytochrome n=1 Tax=Belnapia rosea TaxID=938405 RepID=UPI00087E043E|nr:c-type cytochrome [Belnapia rosea]SDB74678.1 Cytochrome c [Belnapia rosea]
MRGPSLMQVAIAAVVAGGLALALHRPEPVAQTVAPSARAPVETPASASASVPVPMAPAAAPAAALPATAEAWTVPDPDALPDDIYGRTVRRGRDLIARTSSLIGPDATDPAMRFAGNGLDCQSCHLRAGTQQFGLPLAGIWGVFPQYIGRENEVRTLEERVNGCMERSMNGRPLLVEGPEMKAILTYIRHVSAPERVGRSLHGRGSPPLPLPTRAADPVRGRQVFAETCAACHGAGGEGQRLDAAEAGEVGRRYRFPPLWGPDSYNDGAGMARTITAARFVHANMPLGTTFEAPAIAVEDAFDVTAFVNSQPRPHKAKLEADYPDRSKKPVDAGYPPFIGPFTPEQHRYGPWAPIQDWLRANSEASRTTN